MEKPILTVSLGPFFFRAVVLVGWFPETQAPSSSEQRMMTTKSFELRIGVFLFRFDLELRRKLYCTSFGDPQAERELLIASI
jgi:hypothetical protein